MGSTIHRLAALSVAATLLGSPGVMSAPSKRDPGPGCAPDRPAVAHHAGGAVVQNPKGKAHTPPIPCSTKTGFRTSEVSIAVSNAGTVLFQPALSDASGFPIGVLGSVDQGGTWNFVAPTGALARTRATDMNISVDRQTGRIFWTSELGPPWPG